MASGIDLVDRCVKDILKDCAKDGVANTSAVISLACDRLERGGFPKSVDHAARRNFIYARVVAMFNNQKLPKSVSRGLSLKLPQGVEMRTTRIPAWITISDGRNAQRVYALTAKPDHWEANYRLLLKKGKQTVRKADLPSSMVRFLRSHGATCLEDLLS